MTSGGGGGPSGRSPFPASRHTRRNPQPPPYTYNNTSASSLAPPDSFLQPPDGESSSAHSPFLNNLLRFSPKASISPLNHHRGGNGVTNAGQQQRRTRFFDGGTGHASSTAAAAHHHRRSVDASTGGGSSVDSSGEPPPTTHHKASAMGGGGATSSYMTTTTLLLTDLQDGIPLDHLRRLADQHLLSAPEMAAFYAGIVYAKTSSSSNNYRNNNNGNVTADDGLRLARAHAAAGQYEACLRIMEEADLLSSSSSSSSSRMTTTDDQNNTNHNTNYYPWDAIIVAAQALSGKRDWPALIELLEDVCRSCGNNNNNTMAVDNNNDDPLITPAYGHNNSHQRLLLATTTTTSSSLTPGGAAANPLEDSDLPGWMALRRSITMKGSSSSSGAFSSGGIHPLAMVCYFRANAYFATGCGFRACTYWKLALQMDCQCQPAWEALQGQKLLSPQEAYELLTRDLEFAHPEQDWLRSFYLARIEVTTTTLDVAAAAEAAAANSNTSLSTTTTTTVPRGEPKSDTDMMASVPELLSPIPSVLSPNAFSTAKRPAATTNRHHHHHHDLHVGRGGEPSSLLSGTSPTTTMIQADVSAAFTNLWDKHKLQDSPQILAMAARRAYRNYDWKKCLEYCHYLSQLDPTLSEAAFCYVSSLVLLGHKRVLFRLAHQWVEAAPKSARAWFAVGAYYYCIERYHVAQRHFSRATRLDPQCSEAWIAFGCSFAACDESDQALASFRAAHRLSPGDHSALTYMGIEYLRTNNSVLATHFLEAALAASAVDPLCLHELGVLCLQKGRQDDEAESWFRRALTAAFGKDSLEDCVELCNDPYWEPTLFNLGHCYRRQHMFYEAELCYRRCNALCPNNHSSLSALAFCHLHTNDIDKSIEYFHKALAVKPNDSMSTDLLCRVLKLQVAAFPIRSQQQHDRHALKSRGNDNKHHQQQHRILSGHNQLSQHVKPTFAVSSALWGLKDDSLMSESGGGGADSDIDMSADSQ